MPATRKPVKPTTVLGHEIATPVEGELVTLKAQGPKAGVKTSEFWAALTAFVIMVLPTFHVTAAPATVKAVMDAVGGLIIAAYALSRAIVKKPPAQLPPVQQ